eukprot:12756694-Alexandrium_andersonii.AAC.1
MLFIATMACAPTTGATPLAEPLALSSRTSLRSRLTLSSACHSLITLTTRAALLRPSWMLFTSTHSLAGSGSTLPVSLPRLVMRRGGWPLPTGTALRLR